MSLTEEQPAVAACEDKRRQMLLNGESGRRCGLYIMAAVATLWGRMVGCDAYDPAFVLSPGQPLQWQTIAAGLLILCALVARSFFHLSHCPWTCVLLSY